MVLTAPRVYLASARGKVIGCLPSSARPTWNRTNPASRPADLGRRGHEPVLPWTYGPPHASPRYSGATAQDRNELGALLVAAGLGPPPEHALLSLLALNGLRVSETTGADIEHLGPERGPPGSPDRQ